MEATREHPEVLTAFKLEFIHSDIIKKEPEVSTFCLLDCIW